jgi:hypothetical protein
MSLTTKSTGNSCLTELPFDLSFLRIHAEFHNHRRKSRLSIFQTIPAIKQADALLLLQSRSLSWIVGF